MLPLHCLMHLIAIQSTVAIATKIHYVWPHRSRFGQIHQVALRIDDSCGGEPSARHMGKNVDSRPV